MAITVRTITTFPLDGSTREFNINFDYLARKFVQVAIVGSGIRKELVLGTDYRFATATAIRTTEALGGEYDRIEIRRVTSTTERVVNFADGSILRATDLNASQVQAIHIAEEARDVALLSISQDDLGNLDAKGRRITNLSEPLVATDAATKGYVDTLNGNNLRLNRQISPIVGSTVRSLVGFDALGQPVTYPYSGTGTEESFARLASSEGGSLVGLEGGSTVQSRFDLIAGNTGWSSIGTMATIADLVATEPSQDFQRHRVVRYYSDSPSTGGGGEFIYDPSITDVNAPSKDLNVVLFRTPSGKYWKRIGHEYITPYMAGAYGNYDPVLNRGRDDTAAFQAAIRCAESTPLYFTGLTLVGALGKFVACVGDSPNIFRIRSAIYIQPLLVSTLMLGAVIDFRTAPTGSAATPTDCFVFLNQYDAQNHQVSYHELPRMYGKFDQQNHSYHRLVTFRNSSGITTGFRIQLFGGILEGGWQGIATAQEHFYYCKISSTSISHCSDVAFFGYVTSDSGEENVIDNCKFYQSEGIARFVNGMWQCYTTSFVYPYNGDIIEHRAGFLNLENCFLEGYQSMAGYMIRQPGGLWPCQVTHRNTHFAKIKKVSDEVMLNPQPFYSGVGAFNEGIGATFDKVFDIAGVSDDVRLKCALHAGAGGSVYLKGTKVVTVGVGENNARKSVPPAYVPAANATKFGLLDTTFFSSTNVDMGSCGSLLDIAVIGQASTAVRGSFNRQRKTWSESGVESARLERVGSAMRLSVTSGGSTRYAMVLAAVPMEPDTSYVPQVTYSSTAPFTLKVYRVMTTETLTNTKEIDWTAVRLLATQNSFNLPVRAATDTLPNSGPYTEAAAGGGLRGAVGAGTIIFVVESTGQAGYIDVNTASLITI